MKKAVSRTADKPFSLRFKRAAKAVASKGPEKRASLLVKAGVIDASEASVVARRLEGNSGTKHDHVARHIAQREGVSYKRGNGPDVNSTDRAIEVESRNSVRGAIKRLEGFRKPVYIAGTDASATTAALGATKGTSVGVMNSQGKIVKKSTRRKR